MRRSVTAVICAFVCSACIATKKDIEVTRIQLQAEANAKQKVMEEKIATDVAGISGRLDKIEEKLAISKQAQENKINLSFNTIDELKQTILELNNRIDAVDVKLQENTAKSETVIKELYEKVGLLSISVQEEAKEEKAPDAVTVNRKGQVLIPGDEKKAFEQLKKISSDPSLGEVAREGWKKYGEKWPKANKCDVLFYTAETYYFQKSYNSAIEEYQKVEKLYPACSLVEKSYLRIAWSLYYLGKKDLSLKILDAMKAKYPKSSYKSEMKKLDDLIHPKKKKKSTEKKTGKKS